MISPERCDTCGTPLGSNALMGLCPECMMLSALGPGLEQPQPPFEGAPATCPLPSSAVVSTFGDYELLGELAHGGMGVIYKARQVKLDRVVAIKMLLLGQRASDEVVERFKREAQAAARLRHPNIVAIHEVGEVQGQPFFSMDFVPGKDLAKIVLEGPLPSRQAAAHVRAAAEAIHYAHRQGIIHRDLKPSNILVDLATDEVRVTDFGLAKRLDEDSELTLSGQVMGSPNHMAPELAAGHHWRASAASDVFSLGAILYELLTGRPPFLADSIQATLLKIRDTDPVAPRELNAGIPRDLETICLKCLEKEPGARFSSAHELSEELGRFLRGEPIWTQPAGRLEKTWKWSRRNPTVAGALAACALALIGGIAGVSWQWKRAETEARVAQLSLYEADVLLAQQALERSDLGRAKQLLDRHRPGLKSQRDLRGWEWRYLWSQCQSKQWFTLFKGSNAVTALAFSADGKQLAVRRDPGIVMLWDVQGRRVISEHPASAWFEALAASPGSPLLAWGTRQSNGTPSVVVWDAKLHREVAQLPHSDEVVSLAFSPDSQWLATLTRRTAVAVWSLASQQVAASFQIRTNNPILGDSDYGCVRFSPTAQLLAVGAKQTRTKKAHIQLVDWVGGSTKEIPLSPPADGATTMAFTPDGKSLAVGGGYFDNPIHLYELDTGAWSRLEGHKGWIASLAFAPDGQVLASASGDQTIRLWDARRGAELRRFQGHENHVYAVAWTPDGRHLASGGRDGSVRFWDAAATLQEAAYAVLPELTRDLVFTPNGESIVTLSWTNKTVIVRESRTLQEVGRFPSTDLGPRRLALSEDGRRLALGDRAGNVQLWDLRGGQCITNLVVASGWIHQVQFSRSGDHLLCIGERAEGQRVLQLYDAASWSAIDLEGINLEGLYEAMLSPSGQTLAVSHLGGKVAWWNLKLKTRQVLFQWGHLGADIPMAFSADGRWFAAGGEKGLLMLVEVPTKQTRPIARAHLSQINTLAFSPDGKRLMTGGTDGNDIVKIWNVENGREIATLSGKPGFYRLGSSPDGDTLFAAGSEGTVLLWHAPTFEEITALEQAGGMAPAAR